MRWLSLIATLLAWVLCFTRHSAGAMGWWLLCGLVGSIATVLMFAQARIDANSRPEVFTPAMRPPSKKSPPDA